MRQEILQKIFNCFQMMTQDIVSSPINYAAYYSKANGLIELLEVKDCGSVGGFDKKNPLQHITKFNLFDRFLTVLRKENNYVNSECGFTVDSMAEYWIVVAKLRDDDFASRSKPNWHNDKKSK